MRRYLTTLLLGAALCAPIAVHAKEKRYYDPYKKDYHEWNDREDRAYRHWLQEERHREYHPLAKAGKEEQREYWRWRHEHLDWH
jgi:hypothetical protein